MPLRALYIDFNSYFASCEQHERLELRNRPVGVVPMANVDSTCCIAASVEAKEFGVKTGTNVAEARRLCPQIQFVVARHKLYVERHHQLVACVEKCLPVYKELSIDEMACELPPSWRNRAKARQVALQIKDTIAKEVGPTLKSSIGVAPNIFLAKTATELEKRDGLVILEDKDLPHRLYPLELSDLCGIGRRMLPRLKQAGIRNVEDLCHASRNRLGRIWGSVQGERFCNALRGVWAPIEETNRSSIGHSRVLPPEFREQDAALAMCHRLLQKAALRLRDMNLYTRCLSLSLRYERTQLRWGQSLAFGETQDTIALTRVLERLWRQRPDTSTRLLRASISLSNFLPAAHYTPSLFDGPSEKRRHLLDTTMDRVNRKMGHSTVYYASSHDAVNAVPLRIAFNHIPDLETEGDDEKDPMLS